MANPFQDGRHLVRLPRGDQKGDGFAQNLLGGIAVNVLRALFQDVMMPLVVLVMMASSDDSTLDANKNIRSLRSSSDERNLWASFSAADSPLGPPRLRSPIADPP